MTKYISSGSPKLRKLYVTDLTSECFTTSETYIVHCVLSLLLFKPSSVYGISPASATGVRGLFGVGAYLIFGLSSAGLIQGQGLIE